MTENDRRRPITVFKDGARSWQVETVNSASPYTWPTWELAMREANRHARLIRSVWVSMPKHRIVRRLRALQALGYTPEWIAERTASTPEDIDCICLQSDTPNKPPLTLMLFSLFDAIEAKGGEVLADGPTTLAARHGWWPPAAWDDIDDPDEEPSREQGPRMVDVPDWIAPRLRRLIAERTAWIEPLAGRRGGGIPLLAADLGVTPVLISRIINRHQDRVKAATLDLLVSRLMLVVA